MADFLVFAMILGTAIWMADRVMGSHDDTRMKENIVQLVTESREIQKNTGQLVLQNREMLQQMTQVGLQKPQIGLQGFRPMNTNNQRVVRLVKKSLRACKR